MNDRELINFLLENEDLDNQVRARENDISARVLTETLAADFFSAMAKTGREYVLSDGYIYFVRKETHLKIA